LANTDHDRKHSLLIDSGAGTLHFHTEAGPNACLPNAVLWRMCAMQQVLCKGSVSNRAS